VEANLCPSCPVYHKSQILVARIVLKLTIGSGNPGPISLQVSFPHLTHPFAYGVSRSGWGAVPRMRDVWYPGPGRVISARPRPRGRFRALKKPPNVAVCVSAFRFRSVIGDQPSRVQPAVRPQPSTSGASNCMASPISLLFFHTLAVRFRRMPAPRKLSSRSRTGFLPCTLRRRPGVHMQQT
jgi:hypothetical protein